MPLNPPPISPTAIVHRIRELISLEGVITFTALTARLPDCRWITLFRALNHLRKQDAIRLIPKPWDYEIRAVTSETRPLETELANSGDGDAMWQNGRAGTPWT